MSLAEVFLELGLKQGRCSICGLERLVQEIEGLGLVCGECQANMSDDEEV